MEIVGVASAPVSFGVFGVADNAARSNEHFDAMLAAMATAGYDGTELGAPGLFGPPGRVKKILESHRLRAVGAYVPLHLAEPRHRGEDLRTLQRTLDELADSAGAVAVLADWGSEALTAVPARRWSDRSLALDDRQWRGAVETIRRAMDLAANHGIATTFHPHIATFVESRWEISRLLETVDIGLTIDTGHVRLAGTSPAELLREWGDRVNHVHLKDVRAAVMHEAKADGRRDFETWWADVSCPLGEGDVDLVGFLHGLREARYRGWLVVEQDRAPAGRNEFEAIVREQARNNRWVRDRLAPGEVLTTKAQPVLPTESGAR